MLVSREVRGGQLGLSKGRPISVTPSPPGEAATELRNFMIPAATPRSSSLTIPEKARSLPPPQAVRFPVQCLDSRRSCSIAATGRQPMGERTVFGTRTPFTPHRCRATKHRRIIEIYARPPSRWRRDDPLKMGGGPQWESAPAHPCPQNPLSSSAWIVPSRFAAHRFAGVVRIPARVIMSLRTRWVIGEARARVAAAGGVRLQRRTRPAECAISDTITLSETWPVQV